MCVCVYVVCLKDRGMEDEEIVFVFLDPSQESIWMGDDDGFGRTGTEYHIEFKRGCDL
jgi:hypothetical protein